jgi:hypothetical protein
MPLTVALNSMTHLESKGIPSEVSKGLKQDVMEGAACPIRWRSSRSFSPTSTSTWCARANSGRAR